MTTYRPPQDVRQYRLNGMQDKIQEGWQQLCDHSPHDESPRLLHWDSKSEALQIWPWPCYPDGSRVPPDELQEYFCEYQARPPCCLCAYLDSSRYYTAAKISLVETVNSGGMDVRARPFVGEYVAECASDSCGYFVVLERFYGHKVLLHKNYPKRAYRFDISLYDHFTSDEYLFGMKARTGFRRVFVGSTHNEDRGFSRGPNSLKRLREDYDDEVRESTNQLKALVDGGLPASDFWEQFVQCAACDHVLPRHLYPYNHQCAKRKRILQAESPQASEGSSQDAPAGGSSSTGIGSLAEHTSDLLERLAREAAEEDTDDEVDFEVEEDETDDELTPDAVIRYIRACNAQRAS